MMVDRVRRSGWSPGGRPVFVPRGRGAQRSGRAGPNFACRVESPCYRAAVLPALATPPTNETDAALVSAMARGERSAIGELYDVHAPLMHALVRRIVGSAEAAEDIVHDVFLEAWRRAADYDPSRGTVRTWLMLRARSRALDYKKSSAVAKSVSWDGASSAEALIGGPDDAALGAERSRVRDALGGLPEEQHKVLVLGYFEGLSSSEIAERVGVPIGTVKSRVAAALGRLRSALGHGERA
jgi:RNA polymerase sigma-70 factor (ECF subfamily)